MFFVGPRETIPELQSINITSGNDSLAQFSIKVPKNVLSISFTVSIKMYEIMDLFNKFFLNINKG